MEYYGTSVFPSLPGLLTAIPISAVLMMMVDALRFDQQRDVPCN